MQQINHENNLMGAAASTAKSNYKKLSRYRLFFAMAAACFVAPTAFVIYFIVNFSAVGIWAFAITSLLAAAAAAAESRRPCWPRPGVSCEAGMLSS